MLTEGRAPTPAEGVPGARAGVDDRASFKGEELAAIFAELESAPAIVLAVSGGPDSIALLLLASRWMADGTGPTLHVVTIDHGLRPESTDEAAFVAALSADLGRPHATLIWRGAKPRTRLQERARAARYGLLVEHARLVGAAHILTAHHADDQAETVLMRLGRGSGVCGLAGMRRETALAPGIALVRPLLDVPKSRLVALCRHEGQCFVDDPSNADATFARVRLRAEAGAAARLGLDRDTLLRLARRMARAEDALDAEATRLEELVRPELAPRSWRAALAPARSASPEVLQRLLRRAVAHVVGDAAHLRLDRLEAAGDALFAALKAAGAHRATLGGARIVLDPEASILVTPEPPRFRGRPGAGGRSEHAAPAVIKAELTR